MSRVVSNDNVQRVDNIRTSSASSMLATACGAAIAGIAAFAIKELITGDVKLSTSKIEGKNASCIKSTQSCREELTTLFTNNFELERNSAKAVTHYKTALINSLSSSSYQVKDQSTVKKILKEVLQSSSINEVKKKADNLILNIEQQHTSILKNELTSKIKEASCEIEFSNFAIIQNKGNCTIFTCENNAGQALVHEMHIDQKTNQINHIYEYVDNNDNANESENSICEITVNKFQKSLENKGVFFSNSQKKPTGGNAVLPFSTEVKKQLQLKKKNEAVNRARKLNQKRNNLRIN